MIEIAPIASKFANRRAQSTILRCIAVAGIARQLDHEHAAIRSRRRTRWPIIARALAGRTLDRAVRRRSPTGFAQLSLSWDDWLVDWSKQRLTPETLTLLVAHAHERNLPAWIAALFAGEKINLSEGRPALHTALRQQDDTPLARRRHATSSPQIRAAQARMRTLATQIRGGAAPRRDRPADLRRRHHRHRRLGPRPALVCDALAPPRDARAATASTSRSSRTSIPST